MEDKELLQQLKNIRQMKAPERLHTFVHTQRGLLPSKHTGFYFPLVAFRIGFVVAVLLLVVFATGGIVVAATHSSTGTPLYPVKVLIQKVAPAIVKQQEIQGAIAPTFTPTPIRQENNIPTPENERHGKEGGFIPTSSPTKTEEKHGNSGQHDNTNENHNGNEIKKIEDSVNHSVEDFLNQNH